MTTFNQTLLRTTQQFDRLNIRKASVFKSNSLHAGQFYGAKGEWRIPFSVSCSHSKKQEAPTYSSSKEGSSRKKKTAIDPNLKWWQCGFCGMSLTRSESIEERPTAE